MFFPEFSINSVTLIFLYAATKISKLNNVLFGYINIGGKTIKKVGNDLTQKCELVVTSGWLWMENEQRKTQLGQAQELTSYC